MKQFKQKTNERPRCSVNKLGEYVSRQSSPARRSAIIKAQKIPPTYQTIRYTPATSVIVDLLVDGYDDERLLKELGLFFENAATASEDFDKRQASCCHDALKAFRRIGKSLDFTHCLVQPGPQTWKMPIRGVEVSIRPELFLLINGKGGEQKVGFVKLYLSKSHRLDEHAAGVIASVIVAKAQKSVPNRKISSEHVLVVDVFGGQVFHSPKSTKRLFREAEAACEEIAFNWQRFEAS